MSVEIIAELAQGFEGRPEQARLLLKAAAAAGADAAKYQLVYADELATPDYKHYDLFRGLEMGDEVWCGLAAEAKTLGIALHVDIFGTRSLALAQNSGCAAVKLHPTDIANVGLLHEVAASTVPRVLLGAGGAFAGELRQALKILASKEVVVLLGFQGYPTPNEANHITRVRAIAGLFAATGERVHVGFADHAPSDDPLSHALAAAAIGAGATVIEKHLTLGQVMKLEDHEAALNPDQFAEFVRIVRACAEALGPAGEGDDFAMTESERGYRKAIRRHVVAARALRKGERIEPADLALRRTSAEAALTDLAGAYRRKAGRDIAPGEALSPTDLE